MEYKKNLLCLTLFLVAIPSARGMNESNGSGYQSIAWQEQQQIFWKRYDLLNEISKTSSSIAQSWQEVEQYKETVYFNFFEQLGCERNYLEQRWKPLRTLFNTDTAFILIKKEKTPVAFFAVQVKEDKALLYTSPYVLPREQINELLPLEIKKYYPKVTEGYHLVRRGAKPLETLIERSGWQKVTNHPMEPNKTFVDTIPYCVFYKTL